MRNLKDVIAAMIAEIPEGELKRKLERIQEDIKYSAPETLEPYWHSVQLSITRLIYDVQHDYRRQVLTDEEQKVVDIFTGKIEL